jgi:hypothetical protein
MNEPAFHLVHDALASQPYSVDIRVNHSPASAANVAGMVRALPIGSSVLF